MKYQGICEKSQDGEISIKIEDPIPPDLIRIVQHTLSNPDILTKKSKLKIIIEQNDQYHPKSRSWRQTIHLFPSNGKSVYVPKLEETLYALHEEGRISLARCDKLLVSYLADKTDLVFLHNDRNP